LTVFQPLQLKLTLEILKKSIQIYPYAFSGRVPALQGYYL
jgi:hypothetical protein